MDKKIIKPTKTPRERGLTASTDTRVVRRIYKDRPSPSALKIDTVFKEVDENSLEGQNYLAKLKNSFGGSLFILPVLSQAGPGTSKISIPTTIEYVPQQAWYGPYGDREWHDVELVDEVGSLTS